MNSILKTVFGRVENNVLYISKQKPIFLYNTTIKHLDATYILLRIDDNEKYYVVDWL